MEIINLNSSDYHIHSSTFSDGMSSIDEIIKFAGKIGMKEVAITDHSQASIDYFKSRKIFSNSARWSLNNWENVFNDVNVIFGVEGDLLNENGDVCFDIQGYEPEYIILSAHSDVFKGDPKNITDSMINAIKRYHEKVKFIAHPCSRVHFGEQYDIERLIDVANQYNIPLELNGKDLSRGNTILEKIDIVLKKANKVIINSDAHNLFELKNNRKNAIDFLKENKYI